uniref:uncharacterized protein LOC122582923 isoform X2 n=1 Tax=Erigeron canadensis TaxID=72917 RepID=UPI001CB8B62C|nr:uncharacterized protein LOC122582923 isoform X2 [Erigeron canadensis]
MWMMKMIIQDLKFMRSLWQMKNWILKMVPGRSKLSATNVEDIWHTRKMAHLHDLPLDLLDLIIVLLAIFTDGARDLTRFAVTCKQIQRMAGRVHILSIVNLHQFYR